MTTFSAQIIGQTEKALNAILDRHLAGTGLTEPQWVTLTLAVMSGGTLDSEQLADRVADVFKNGPAPARERIAELTAAQLVATDGEGRVHATEAGQALWTRLRGVFTGITEDLWGDLPAEDLAVTGRVLSVVLDRANVVLAAA